MIAIARADCVSTAAFAVDDRRPYVQTADAASFDGATDCAVATAALSVSTLRPVSALFSLNACGDTIDGLR